MWRFGEASFWWSDGKPERKISCSFEQGIWPSHGYAQWRTNFILCCLLVHLQAGVCRVYYVDHWFCMDMHTYTIAYSHRGNGHGFQEKKVEGHQLHFNRPKRSSLESWSTQLFAVLSDIHGLGGFGCEYHGSGGNSYISLPMFVSLRLLVAAFTLTWEVSIMDSATVC